MADGRDIIPIVAEDLIYLRSEWDQEIADSSLRRSSVVLRRLVADKDFGRAWRALGIAHEPVVAAPCLDTLIAHVKPDDIEFVQAGGACYGGAKVYGAARFRRALSDAEIKADYERTKSAGSKQFTLSRFCESACIILQGQVVKRRELIQYVANKCGGGHFDPERNHAKEVEQKFSALDAHASRAIAGKNAIYFELLSIGQCLASSPYTQLFLDRAKYAIPSPQLVR